jgi:serine/threonine protein phosphatase PrpC
MPIGPHRVWLKDTDIPGLAMSRSLGDKVAHSVGVSSLPEIISDFVDVDDCFLVIGSDGVFEFMTNEAVSEIVMPHYE